MVSRDNPPDSRIPIAGKLAWEAPFPVAELKSFPEDLAAGIDAVGIYREKKRENSIE